MQKNRFPQRLPVIAVLCLLLCGIGVSDQEHLRPHNCRLWGGVGERLPGELIAAHLSGLPFSMENLSVGNRNGWSILHYLGHSDHVSPHPVEPAVRRGQPAAVDDSLFAVAVGEVALAEPALAVSHIRACSSGLCDIPNPHPFERVMNGKRWFFAHNGSVAVDVLLDLIRPDFLADNQPEHGVDPGEWIDSELYFLFLIQCFEDHDWRIEHGLGHAIQILLQAIPGSFEMLNFVLTDCETMWGYREGISLYYRYDDAPPACTWIASRYPSETQGDWIELQEGQLIVMRPSQPPAVLDIQDYFDNDVVPDPDPGNLAQGGIPVTIHPNPFNSVTTISCELPVATTVHMRVFDISGRLVRVLDNGSGIPANRYHITWDGRNDLGRQMPSGMYFCRLKAGRHIELRRLSLLR